MKISEGSILFDESDVAQLSDDAVKALTYEASRHADKTASDILSGAVNNFIFDSLRRKEEVDLAAARSGLRAFFAASPEVKAQIAKLLGVAEIPAEPLSAIE